jgi:hypothetical protein
MVSRARRSEVWTTKYRRPSARLEPLDINKSRDNLDPGVVVFLRQLLVRTGDKAPALLLNSNNMLSEHCQTDAPLWV